MHVFNMIPTLVVQNKTIREAWCGMKPIVEYFKVFRYLAHVYVLDHKRIKLDDKSIQCILLRLNDESKAYRLFDLVSSKIIVIKGVIFKKNKA